MEGDGGAAAVQVLVQNLIDHFKNEISLFRGFDREAQNLILNLNDVEEVLNSPSEAFKGLRRRLEEAAFKADNVLDELNYRPLSEILNTNINEEKVPCFSTCIRIAHKRKMAVSIKEINEELERIKKQANDIVHVAPYAGMETDSISSDPIFIGRDEVVSEIVETLITSVATHVERVFSILPIVGMGGLGKTTLTRRVFHHQNMETQFGSRIWVHVSQVFDPFNLFKKILKELPSTSSKPNNDEIRQEKYESRQVVLKELEEALKDKTYLLVLDDVWNEDVLKWEDFLNSLLGVTTTKGNGIIVTTRNREVASIVRTLPIHRLKPLSEEDCWSIIRAKTFENEDIPLDNESIGKEIAERCGGLPLAASVVGGVLRDKSVDEWSSIKQNWLSLEGEGENDITKILRLSFNNLFSPSLKKCFAYCSIFPKGHRIVKEELIEMWMGEGFLGRNDDMESLGDKFYNVLLHSSLLQNMEACEERCVMHHLVHDLASFVLGKADGVSRVRYVIHEEGESNPITEEVAQHLRTLIFRADQLFDDNIFSNFKYLHVLTLKGRSFEVFPNSIRKLIHLRSLNISETKIFDLPDWIAELYYLQTLRAECLVKLPSTIKYLINLRHLLVPNEIELPADIGGLTSLQTLLADFIVRDTNGYKIEELGSLNNLKGSLKIKGLEKVHDKQEAKKAKLFKKSKLSELLLIWDDNREDEVERNDEKVLKALQPHSNLKKLEIEGFCGKRFPLNLVGLVEIKFHRCRKCEDIPMMGHLRSLKSLSFSELSNVRSINSSFYGTGMENSIVFPVLESLSLINMPSLKEWAEVESGGTSEVNVFPHLQSLNISNCHQLVKAPTHFPSRLKSLTISGCNQLATDYWPLLRNLTSLTNLVLEGLNGLQSHPYELLCNNPNINVLIMSGCP